MPLGWDIWSNLRNTKALLTVRLEMQDFLKTYSWHFCSLQQCAIPFRNLKYLMVSYFLCKTYFSITFITPLLKLFYTNSYFFRIFKKHWAGFALGSINTFSPNFCYHSSFYLKVLISSVLLKIRSSEITSWCECLCFK